MADRSDLVIRPAAVADLPAVLALYAQPDFDDGDVMTPAEAAGFLDRFAAYPDYTLFVAEAGGAIVGSFALLVMDNIGHRGAPSAIVEDVVVAPDAQGRGVGAAMMRFALRASRHKGCYKMMLSSNTKRERAHAFYEGLGFARHGYSFRVDLGNDDAVSETAASVATAAAGERVR
ncbi:GNAT family N-acetyltransferase [Rhodoplanes serenus]|uniref:GNAT family N-acetyltransferase n=1 Tax=Rhodoplanes serenus TaxID=200615 RepID=UPI001FE161ED|nr:GNAT family N-acetyltransferase [Rhodoplanes serenus]